MLVTRDCDAKYAAAMTSSAPSPRRVEEASLNAWPALHQVLLDGWVLRFTRGFTKRANCVVPLYPGTLDLAAKVRECENRFAREGLKTVFRLTDIDTDRGIDAYLGARGYTVVDPTEVMVKPLLDSVPPSFDPDIEELPRALWLEHYNRITLTPTSTQPLHTALLKGIHNDHAFLVRRSATDALPVSCGLAVADLGLVGLFDVATCAGARRTGHARATVLGLLAWGARTGAKHAYLQVMTDNSPAVALYHQLGFTTGYRYWYRIGPA